MENVHIFVHVCIFDILDCLRFCGIFEVMSKMRFYAMLVVTTIVVTHVKN